ncbi:MAG: hypothetical protein AVDCRST_MAG05-1829 [uncultured Rubrobacteraceae bacterium]|uniref:Uncharacterized protein n=1 Tax=uncultured Rubrobacteraceae bacterium TaxID=349277 RepID=A0A6J4S629_9ACTN|nr:MAG: hypothetical protein AVDCRST_MAG05-1829 [uncultured Rubrobacteraceae bacterium]
MGQVYPVTSRRPPAPRRGADRRASGVDALVAQGMDVSRTAAVRRDVLNYRISTTAR